MKEEILQVETRCFNQEVRALQQVRREADDMHAERVAQLSFEASMRFQSQEVHMCSLRDHVSRLAIELACLAASRVTAGPDSDPTAIYVALRQELRESEQR